MRFVNSVMAVVIVMVEQVGYPRESGFKVIECFIIFIFFAIEKPLKYIWMLILLK